MKKALAIIGLLILIALIAFWIFRKQFRSAVPPKEYRETILEKIDIETGEIISLPREKWLDLGARKGKYKNPKTQKYTMVDPIKCVNCGEKIIPVLVDPETEGPAVLQSRMATYRCPKCGKLAYPPLPRVTLPATPPERPPEDRER